MLTIDKLWYRRHPLRWVLFPLSLLFRILVCVRRFILITFYQHRFSVPIIVVGNITVGGVGKTPLVIALVQQLQARGLRVGIVSRGYGAKISDFPYDVQINDQAADVGDEPLLLAKRTGCPVVIAPVRAQAVQYLLDHYQTQIVISDDGLQHYQLGRTIEIAVIDGVRGLGNGLCLPAGPLRESATRLNQVDFVVVNGATWPDCYRMDLKPGHLTQLTTGASVHVDELTYPVAAIAAIGHPARFFSTLETMGVKFNPYSFVDHYAFKPDDLSFSEKMLVMTEKDAVKCHAFATDSMYFLSVDADVRGDFWDTLWTHTKLQGYL